MAEAPILDQPVRTALATPVERRHREAPGPQVADHFVIFLDELRTAMEQADRAFRPGCQRRPMRAAQPHAATCAAHFAAAIGGAGMGGWGEAFHDSSSSGVRAVIAPTAAGR